MNTVVCKFDHNTSLQCNGDEVSFLDDSGVVENINLGALCIFDAVNLREGLVHVFTTDGVFSLRTGAAGLEIRKIGETL